MWTGPVYHVDFVANTGEVIETVLQSEMGIGKKIDGRHSYDIGYGSWDLQFKKV